MYSTYKVVGAPTKDYYLKLYILVFARILTISFINKTFINKI